MWDNTTSQKCLFFANKRSGTIPTIPNETNDTYKHGHFFKVKTQTLVLQPVLKYILPTNQKNIPSNSTTLPTLRYFPCIPLTYLPFTIHQPFFVSPSKQQPMTNNTPVLLDFQPTGKPLYQHIPPRQWVENRWPCQLYHPSRSWCVHHFSLPPAAPKVHLDIFPMKRKGMAFKEGFQKEDGPQDGPLTCFGPLTGVIFRPSCIPTSDRPFIGVIYVFALFTTVGSGPIL